MPGVRFDVIDATEFQVPTSPEVMSYGIVTEPPAVGPVTLTRYCVELAGADAMFAPLVPSRFSAPQFWPEAGSPVPAFPSGPYALVTCSPVLDAVVAIQISKECVVALLKFLTPSQSTTNHRCVPELRPAT